MKRLFLIFLLMTNISSYAAVVKNNNICKEVNELKALLIEQGPISKLIFGVKRTESEIAWIAKVQNKLLNGKMSKSFYTESLDCISALKKINPRFDEDKNLNVIQVDLFFGYANSLKERFDLSPETSAIYHFLFDNIDSDDYILSYSIIRALGVFSTPKSVDTLSQYILDKNNRFNNRKLAMNSLSYMASHYSIKKLEEVKQMLKDSSGKDNENLLK